jgi:hypothetical protein
VVTQARLLESSGTLIRQDGAAVRVTEGGGTPSFEDPSDITGLLGWWDGSDATTFTFSSGVVVSQWADKSGANRHMISSGGGPSRSVTAPSGLAGAVAFTDQWMRTLGTTDILNGTQMSFAGVVRRDADRSGQSGRIMSVNKSSTDDWFNSGGIIYDGAGGFPAMYRDPAGLTPSSTIAVGQWCAFIAVWDGTNFTMYVNGASVGTVASTGTFDPDHVNFGANGFGGEKGAVSIAEVTVYNTALDATQRSDLHDYFTDKWLTPSIWSPANLNPATWWDASDATTFSYSSGALVSEWRDKSGGARHLVQATPANQPTRDGTINGLPAVVFVKTDPNYLQSAGVVLAQPFTLAAVTDLVNPQDAGAIVIGRTGALSARFWHIWDEMRFTSPYTSPGSPHKSPGTHVWVTHADGASTFLRKDGVPTSIPTGTEGWPEGISVGYNSVYSEWGWGGSLCELLIIPGIVTGADLTALESYLTDKWLP